VTAANRWNAFVGIVQVHATRGFTITLTPASELRYVFLLPTDDQFHINTAREIGSGHS